MRVIVFDTETTGLPIAWDASAEDVNNWPRVVEIAWLVLDDFSKMLYVRQVIRPEGFSVPKEIAAIHGISNEEALRVGSSLNYVMACFVKAIASADLIVAHNISFDYPVVNCELIRLGIDSRLSEVDHFCTMMSTVELCKIPGVSGYKWPKLQELYRFLFNAEFSDAHSALADANATADCFIELSKRNLSSSAALTHPLITLLAEMPSVLQSVWNWSLCRCSIQQAISFLPSFGGIILLSISACSKCHRRSFV